MRVLMLSALMVLFLPLSVVGAEDYKRVNVRVYDGNRVPIHHTGPVFSSGDWGSGCFPTGCGGISGPFRNPDPDARKPENLTSCIYNVAGTLLYEREGKTCPYKYVDQNQMRVERRRQKWLRAQAR